MKEEMFAASNGGFRQFNLRPAICRGIADAGFDQPRPIQLQALPPALAGQDVLGLAQTGTGKTAAFALPILQQLAQRRGSGKDPWALVIAPTRELAQQIAAEIDLLGKHLPLRIGTLYGGVSTRRQIEGLRRGVDVIVACPGRLLDLRSNGYIRLDRVEMLVIDEADHMFDMGFLPDLRRIVAAVPQKRQTLLFSATMPNEIRDLANGLLSDPVVIERDTQAPADTIEHALYPIVEKRKLDLLDRLLSSDEFSSAIVFTRTKYRARTLASRLERLGHRAQALQGNMSQNARDRTMDGFRRRRFEVLVATDIAARGIDVANVSHVINYDVPNTPDAYVHRIGRTGRAEQLGRGYTFVTAEEQPLVRAIEGLIKARIPWLRIDGLTAVLEKPKEKDANPRTGVRNRRTSQRDSNRPTRSGHESRKYRGTRAGETTKFDTTKRRSPSRRRAAPSPSSSV